MIDAEKRVVKFGDGDVKAAYCELGIVFGDASVPDGDNIENDYAFGLQLSYRDVIAMNELLDSMVAAEHKEFTYLDTTFCFNSETEIEALRGLLLSWSELAIMEAKNLECYLRNKGVENNNIPSVDMVQLEDGDYVPRECCTFTNPATSGGKSYVDDVDMPCAENCDNECSKCIIQRILNEYAVLSDKQQESEG